MHPSDLPRPSPGYGTFHSLPQESRGIRLLRTPVGSHGMWPFTLGLYRAQRFLNSPSRMGIVGSCSWLSEVPVRGQTVLVICPSADGR